MSQRTTYKEGDLVEFTSCSNWALYMSRDPKRMTLREHPIAAEGSHADLDYNKIYVCVEGKIGLIVYVARNKLEQHLGYRVLIKGKEVFCKSVIAAKYFKLVGTQGNESR